MTSYSRYFTVEDIQNIKDGTKTKQLQTSTCDEQETWGKEEFVYKNSSTSLHSEEMDDMSLPEEEVVLKTDSPQSLPWQPFDFLQSNNAYTCKETTSEEEEENIINNNSRKWCRCVEESEETSDVNSNERTSTKFHNIVQAASKPETEVKSEITCTNCQPEIREKSRKRKRIIELWMKFFGSSSSTESSDSYCASDI